MAVQLVGRIGSGDERLDGDLRDIDIVAQDAGTFLYAATGQTGGISVYRLDKHGGPASLADSSHYSLWGIGVGSFDAVDLDGQTQLILSGLGDGKLIRYRLEDDGGLARLGKLDLPGPTTQTHSALTAAPLGGGRTAIYTVDSDTGKLSGWLTSGSGGLAAAVETPGKIAPLSPDGPVMLVTSGSFLLAADSATQGVRSFRIAADTGALTAIDSLGAADGLGVALPAAIETVTAHGGTWVVLAAAGSSSLSVMRLTEAGALIPTDHILDTRATRFAGVTALEVIEADGHVFVLAGGADDGLSLFSLLPGGQLVHMQTLANDTGMGLDNVTGISAARIGDEIQIFVTSGGDAGLSQFTLPLADLGAVIRGRPAAGGNTPLAGTSESDLILGREDQTTLRGRAGDDILVSDVNGGILTGGAGADIFVLHPTSQQLRITDFQPGTDQLDLAQFPMLRSIDQLGLIPTSAGIRVTYGTTRIDIRSQSGDQLTAQDLWPDGFATPDRIAILNTPQETLIRGTRGADLLLGDGGADLIRARAGDDTARGRAGADTLLGGSGADRLLGGSGQDLIKGGTGRDRLTGGGGSDTIKGGAGHDQLFGKGGGDRLKGGAGQDDLTGARGQDRLTGGKGDDMFIFAARHGIDRITDFTPGEDHLRFDIRGLDLAGLTIRAQGADTVIGTGTGKITLIGLDPGDLGADDFLFL